MAQDKHPIENITFGIIPITVYRGCLLTKLVGGYEIFGTKCKTPQEVDLIIDKAGKSLKDSIVVVNNGDWESTNTEKSHQTKGNAQFPNDTDTGGMIGSQDEKQG